MEKLLTIKDVSEVLQVNERTVHRLLHANKIPATKVGNQWRFHPAAIETWFLNGGEESIGNKISNWKEEDEFQLFSPSRVLLDIQSPTPESAIKAMVNTLSKTGHLLQTALFYHAILERETVSSTAIGEGIAIPHAWHPVNDLFRVPLIVCARLKNPIHFNAIDQKPVDLLFLPCSRRGESHLELLAAVTHAVRSKETLEALRNAKTPEDFIQSIQSKLHGTLN